MSSFRSTRMISRYGDGSELHFLIDSNSYVWMRIKTDDAGKSVADEVVLNATDDYGAQQEIANIVNREMWGCDAR